MQPRVAVTGMAAWTCFGRGLTPLLRALATGQRGQRKIERMPTGDSWFRTHEAMQIQLADLLADLPAGFDPRRAQLECTTILAVLTALDAYADSGLSPDEYPARRFSVFNGTSQGSNHGIVEVLGQQAAGLAPDPAALATLTAWTSRRIAHRVGARGPNLTINTACSSSLNTVGQAAALLAAGEIDCAIAGGSDMFSYLSYAGFNSLMALDPIGCRPFDRRRDGMSLGDGAAYVVLEREQDALARGASLWGLITGYACAGEGHHPTGPEPTGRGAIEVMRKALQMDETPTDLSYVAAHGTGTQANDSTELLAITDVVSTLALPGPVYVSSIKGHIGHTLGAAGALQVVASLACIGEGLIPGNLGLDEPISHQPPLVLPKQSVKTGAELRLVLCNAFGFGGSVASLCVRPAKSSARRGGRHGALSDLS